jgi:dihydroxyacetone kinase DhaKLM complex PTS-EIIA-like component DhaM
MPLVIIVECRGTDDSRLLTAAECIHNLSTLQCDHDKVLVCRLRGEEDETIGSMRLNIQREVKPATRTFSLIQQLHRNPSLNVMLNVHFHDV